MKLFFMLVIILFSTIHSQNNEYIDSTKIKDPEIAFKLGLIPGLGQFYNEKYLKSIGFIVGEYFAVRNFNHHKNINNVGSRNTYAWWVFGLYIWSLIDSYVDAQLSTFPVKKIISNHSEDSLKVKLK